MHVSRTECTVIRLKSMRFRAAPFRAGPHSFKPRFFLAAHHANPDPPPQVTGRKACLAELRDRLFPAAVAQTRTSVVGSWLVGWIFLGTAPGWLGPVRRSHHNPAAESIPDKLPPQERSFVSAWPSGHLFSVLLSFAHCVHLSLPQPTTVSLVLTVSFRSLPFSFLPLFDPLSYAAESGHCFLSGPA